MIPRCAGFIVLTTAISIRSSPERSFELDAQWIVGLRAGAQAMRSSISAQVPELVPRVLGRRSGLLPGVGMDTPARSVRQLRRVPNQDADVLGSMAAVWLNHRRHAADDKDYRSLQRESVEC
jgi:hypothetical protein